MYHPLVFANVHRCWQALVRAVDGVMVTIFLCRIGFVFVWRLLVWVGLAFFVFLENCLRPELVTDLGDWLSPLLLIVRPNNSFGAAQKNLKRCIAEAKNRLMGALLWFGFLTYILI